MEMGGTPRSAIQKQEKRRAMADDITKDEHSG
jgi:hypothetical protein